MLIKKTISLIISKDSGDTYVLEKENDLWVFQPSLMKIIPHIVSMDVSIKVDGSNSVVSQTKK